MQESVGVWVWKESSESKDAGRERMWTISGPREVVPKFLRARMQDMKKGFPRKTERSSWQQGK